MYLVYMILVTGPRALPYVPSARLLSLACTVSGCEQALLGVGAKFYSANGAQLILDPRPPVPHVYGQRVGALLRIFHEHPLHPSHRFRLPVPCGDLGFEGPCGVLSGEQSVGADVPRMHTSFQHED